MRDFAKIIIFLTILILFIMFAILINRPGKVLSDNEIADNELKKQESITLQGLDYMEMKGSQTLFKISAEKGSFSFNSGEGKIENINGEVYLKENRTIFIKGKHGRIIDNGKIVILEDNVTGTMEDGAEFTSKSMSYIARDNIIVSDQPVSLRDQTGTISASSMRVNLNDNIIQFSGNVDAIIKKFLRR